MIYDSEQQKQFILEAVKKYPTTYETALQLANTFGLAIQSGQIVDPQKQLEAFPPPKGPAKGSNAESNGNRRTRRAKAKTEKADTPPN